MRKVASILLAWIALLLLLAGCKGPYSDGEAREILAELLQKDAELNRYIWGDGFTTLEDSSEDVDYTESCKYYRVNADAPYHSVASFKKAIEEVYSSQLIETIYQYAFENTNDSMARFCDFTQNDEVVDLQIDVTKNHPPFTLSAVLYPSTAVVKRSTTTIIEAEVEYSNGMSEDRQTVTVRILKQDGVWKLDTRTWAGAVA